MKTGLEWWNEVKNDNLKMNSWLQKQCYGEYQAYLRIGKLATKYNNSILRIVADQELKHYEWIKDYLVKNNIEPITEHEERYWKEVNMNFDTLEEASAIGAHAEEMRLERIRIIAKDTEFTELASIFNKIQTDEEFHVKAFTKLTTEEKLAVAKIGHEQGMLELGLII
jgi:tRNA isopentenyl-2-thiomethyl-A-37 hydroxylase MiaE